jgi:hypothetical protein
MEEMDYHEQRAFLQCPPFPAGVVKLADARDSKERATNEPWRFPESFMARPSQ